MPHALLPDLRAVPATDFIVHKVSVRGRNYSLLRFSQSFGNVGRGPLQVRRGESDSLCSGARKAAGYQDVYMRDGSTVSLRLKECMVYHPYHGHWHIANVAQYDLFRLNSSATRLVRKVRSSDKVSFCLFDEHALDRSLYNGPSYRSRYRDCDSRVTGITPGWADEYSYRVYGQWVNITGIPDGVYALKTTLNPSKNFREVTSRNNVAWRKIRLYDNGNKVEVLE